MGQMYHQSQGQFLLWQYHAPYGNMAKHIMDLLHELTHPVSTYKQVTWLTQHSQKYLDTYREGTGRNSANINHLGTYM